MFSSALVVGIRGFIDPTDIDAFLIFLKITSKHSKAAVDCLGVSTSTLFHASSALWLYAWQKKSSR
jgi:hypothetical protein